MTDTINYQNPKPAFDIGRVLNRTFGAIKNNLVSFLGASLIIMGIPMLIIGLFPLFIGADGEIANGGLSESAVMGFVGATVFSAIFIMVGSIILQGALIFGAVADFNGRKAPLSECLSIAFKYFFPLLGLGILVALGTMAGFIALIIPGIFIALGWSIAAPILIIEGKGITDSIGRSWNLTKGYKRWILLLFIIIMIISAIITAIITALSLVAGDPVTIALEGGSPTYYILNAIFSAIAQAISTMISATGVAAVYYEIRQLKEGIGAESLASIFD